MPNNIRILARRAAWIAACAALSASAHAVHAQPFPLSEDEVYGFLMEMSAADKRCDVDWLQSCYMRDATLTFEEVGKPAETVRPDEYFKAYRKDCYHTTRTFARNKMSVRIEPARAVVRGRWEQPTFARYFFLDPVNFKWIEETLTLVRAGEGIGVADVHQRYEPKPDEKSEDTTAHPEPVSFKKIREFFREH
jgi:hypothetical protein